MMRRAAFVIALGLIVWLASLSPAIRPAPSVHAEPIGAVEPVSGSLAQTYTFAFAGFQPFTQLTLSVLPPGVANFIIIDTGSPVITDGEGRAVVQISLLQLISDPAVLASLPIDPGQAAALLPLVTVTWGNAPGRGFAAIRADACDTVNCVESIGTFALPGQ
jgi:hypothetical protein